MQTYLNRDYRKNWRASTTVKLADGWQLDITTRKVESGELVSSASVAKVERGFATHRMFADYSRNISRVAARCTEKAVSEQHAKALARIDDIKADMLAHYAARGETVNLEG